MAVKGKYLWRFLGRFYFSYVNKLHVSRFHLYSDIFKMMFCVANVPILSRQPVSANPPTGTVKMVRLSTVTFYFICQTILRIFAPVFLLNSMKSAFKFLTLLLFRNQPLFHLLQVDLPFLMCLLFQTVPHKEFQLWLLPLLHLKR